MSKHPPTPLGRVNTRFDYNIDRVQTLLKIRNYEFDVKNAHDDVLRSAVVLLHATLEDLLRGLLALKLPEAKAVHLHGIYFDRGRHKESITVAELSNHKTKTVDTYLRELISVHLERTTFNNTRDVGRALEKLGFGKSSFKTHRDNLAAPMRRRHKIVHESDRDPADDYGHGRPRKIDRKDVEVWVNHVEAFAKAVLNKLKPKPLREKL